MGERKGTNKYYPPDFDYKTHKSLAGYHGQHPLRERARKLNQGILIIRFEMPYNIWCGGCNSHIGMGVRYNAEKSKIGNYYSTPIYKFRMKCHLCDNHFEIKTDPASHDYVIIEGARRKEQRWDPKENEQIVPEDRDTHKKLESDAMYRLEHGADDKGKIKAAIPGIKQIELQNRQWKDDYILNRLARDKFRAEKKSLKTAAELDGDLLKRSSLDIKLVKEHADDVQVAKLLKYRSLMSFDEKQKQKREQIESQSIFETGTVSQLQRNNESETNIPSSKTPVQSLREKLGLNIAMGKKPSPFSPASTIPAKDCSLSDMVSPRTKDGPASDKDSSESICASSPISGDELQNSGNKLKSIVAGYGSSSDSESHDSS